MTNTPVTKSKRKSKKISMIGKKFGRWTVLEEAGKKQRAFKYTCICECGTIKVVAGTSLRDGSSQGCGCLRKKELAGETFGRLTAIEEAGKDKHGSVLWRCVCDCGNVKIIKSHYLIRGTTKSCGCLHRETITKHGMHNTETYQTWVSMLQRCNNSKDTGYKWYGGRGITVCDRWLNFENFFADMKERPEGLTIERIDNELGYYKENCCWATQTTQMHNQRPNIKNKTGIRGVYFAKKSKKYCVYIQENYKRHRIGYFDTLEQAAEARQRAEQKYWGKQL